jgi:hypothetical protein
VSARIGQLKALERHQGLIITSDQIRMEFLKNRQKVIIDSIKNIIKPGKSSVPNIVQEYQPAKCWPSTSRKQ